MRSCLRSISVLLLTQVLLVAWAGVVTSDDSQEEEPKQSLVLRVGVHEELRTKNPLREWDQWTSGHLDPVYDEVAKLDQVKEEPIPYLLKGIDADDSGTLDLHEYGIFEKEANPTEVTAYYDFNGVYSHDGVQMTMHDLLFSYHLAALNSLRMEVNVLKDNNGLLGSNYSTTRWLNVWPDADDWSGAIPTGPDPSLLFALHFSLNTTYGGFAKYTLGSLTLIPRHIWEGTGKRCLDATAGVCSNWLEDIHVDFGHAYDESTNNGIPDTHVGAFRFWNARSWIVGDNDVIGTGPFEFDQWFPGFSTTLIRFEDYNVDPLDCVKEGVPQVCQGNFFSRLHKPYVDVIEFRLYMNPRQMVFALMAGEIDYVGYSVPVEYIPDLVADANISLMSSASKGFAYLGYQMRMSPFGYPDNNPSLGDHGFWFRRAVAHTIDRDLIVTTLLQNFGIVANQPISPAQTRWYNASIVGYDFDLDIARQILDDHYTLGGFGLGWSGGWRNLPTIGNMQIEVLCAQADHDPVHTSSCNMIATNMRDVGINAVLKTLPFPEILDELENRDAAIWLHEPLIHRDPPEFYYDFFSSMTNRSVSLNYGGFQNQTFDDKILETREELDRDRSVALIKAASSILVENLPYDPIFFRTNVEAYRHDRFVNWTEGPGSSIFYKSYWSWMGVHPPGIVVEMTFPTGTMVNETETLAFDLLVTNFTTGLPVDGANVTITCLPAGPVISPSQGLTVNGSIGLINFTAPEVDYDTFYSVITKANLSGMVEMEQATVLVLNTDTNPWPPVLQSAQLTGSAGEDVTMEWTLSADDGQGNMSVIRYDIYRGLSYSTRGWNYTLRGSVPNGTSQFVDAGAGEGDSTHYYYRMCACSSDGNSTCSRKQAGKFTRPLSQGPSLVSLPLVQSNGSIEKVLQTVEYDNAWTYDPSIQAWRLHTDERPYLASGKANHTMGIWINVTEDCNLTLAGIVPTQTSVQLYAGWNLVSFPSFNTTYTVADLKAETGATRVEGYELAPPYFLRVLTDGDVLQAGYGYWVKVDAPISWIVGNS
ncbi:MAG: ABC transporter substrate-binding protein [Candidatus Thermoplasmatota archaeon]|nr:ABC transporter substrate-binding protein [Candidatus Thermoplasmatota archaeon]